MDCLQSLTSLSSGVLEVPDLVPISDEFTGLCSS